MSDAKQRPDDKPQNQTGEDKGAIKRPQRTDRNTLVDDLPRGSEVETRNSSNQRS